MKSTSVGIWRRDPVTLNIFSGVRLGINEVERVKTAKTKRMLRAIDCLRVSGCIVAADAFERLIDLTKPIRRGRTIGPIVKISVCILFQNLSVFAFTYIAEHQKNETYVDQDSIVVATLTLAWTRLQQKHRKAYYR